MNGNVEVKEDLIMKTFLSMTVGDMFFSGELIDELQIANH